MTRRHRRARHAVGFGQHFFHRSHTSGDGLGGAAFVLHDKGFKTQAFLQLLFLEQFADLIAFTTEAHHQRTGEIGMTNVSGHGPAQQVHRLAGHFHAAAGAVGKRHHAVDVRIIGQAFGCEIFSDLVHHGGRAIHR